MVSDSMCRRCGAVFHPARDHECVPGQITLHEHVPGFVDANPRSAVVSSLDELVAVPWIEKWPSTIADAGLPWLRYSVVRRGGNKLMAEYNEGRRWWVIAVLPDELPDWLTLPEWEPKG